MMKVTLDLSDEFVAKLENKVNEQLPQIVEEVLEDNVDELLKDVVLKQLKSCALIYIQGKECREKMFNKVKPIVDNLVNSND